MILLEPSNKILSEILSSKFESPQEKINTTLADYDGVTYNVSTPSEKTMLRVAMQMKCYSKELVKYGADRLIKKEYSEILSDQQTSDEIVLEFDVEKFISKKDEIIEKVTMLKTNAMGAVFEKAFDEQLSGKPSGELMPVHYRDEESIFVKASNDRVTVIFSTVFKDETDRIFGKVFLQEFVDCRKQTNLQNAPQVLYTNRDPPMELRGRSDIKEGENVGYVTFVLFPRHFTSPQQRKSTVQLVQYFRNYLHYHIKCSKAYMHSRMRAKVESWLKVLNRAKPEVDDKNKDKKTASGRTFVRK